MKSLNFSFVILAIIFWCMTSQVIATPQELEEELSAAKIPCDGVGNVCVLSNKCENGFVDGNTLPRSYSNTKLCDVADVCCTLTRWDPEKAQECAVRNLNTYPQGPTPIHANFAEFPWQAMILRETTKSLLCGGVIIKKNFVLTSADCVANYKSIDVLTKGGEWKLGSDDEGKPFQIVRLKSMTLHPDFNFTKVSHNLAILHLERDYQFDEHIQPLCLDESDRFPDTTEGNVCIITGWGQEALKIHQKDAIEHYTNLTFIPAADCIQHVGIENFNPAISVCAVADSSACDFDFGSALACQVGKDSQEFVLKGIYTHNTGCFAPSQFGGEKPTLVFVEPDIEWIKRVTKLKRYQ